MVLIPIYQKFYPLSRGFFLLILIVAIAASLLAGCSNNKQSTESTTIQNQTDRSDEFWLLPLFQSVFDQSTELMKESPHFQTGETNFFDIAYLDGSIINIELELENLYATKYPDERRIAFYPVKPVSLPEVDETEFIGFLHYFDENTLNIFFQVFVTNSSKTPFTDSRDEIIAPSNYLINLVDHNGKSYGLARSRILMKKDLEAEEAFRKFDASIRNVQIGTNLVDKNKFLYIFVKIPEWDDQIFQIYLRWY